VANIGIIQLISLQAQSTNLSIIWIGLGIYISQRFIRLNLFLDAFFAKQNQRVARSIPSREGVDQGAKDRNPHASVVMGFDRPRINQDAVREV
jgi:hypothetical protein